MPPLSLSLSPQIHGHDPPSYCLCRHIRGRGGVGTVVLFFGDRNVHLVAIN
jgi:hypothetical protein